jgi:hypothetical protein
MLLALQVTDPFGRLQREHVLRGIIRGSGAAHAASSEQILDTSGGGAGLGLWRIFSAGAVTLIDVVPGHDTTVTAVFDLDLNPRESRNLPPSLHLFDRASLRW